MTIKPISALFVSALLYISPVAAQDKAAQPPQALPKGTYQPLTTWQKIRLGATTLVNPKVATEASIVYAFDPQEVLKRKDVLATLQHDLLTGQIKIADVKDASGNNYLVVNEGAESSQEIADTLTQFSMGNTGRTTKFVATQANIGDAKPTGTWISWGSQKSSN